MTDDNHNAGEMVKVTLIGLRDTVPFAIRLRSLLKHALRSCRLRAVRVEDVPAFRDAAEDAGRGSGEIKALAGHPEAETKEHRQPGPP